MKLRISGGTFLAGAVLACIAWLPYYASGSLAREADKVMQREVARGRFSGAVLVSREGRVLFEKAYGLASVERNVSNTVHTKFQIASITKTFTAILMMQLEGQGRLALHDPICRYIEECPPGWGGITLHHLLSHTSGIFNVTRVPELEAQRATPQTRRQMMSRFLTKPLAFAPGEQFEYSNSNYYLLGLVIEKVTGQPYEVVLRERILKPLEMHDTGIEHRGAAPPLHASGYRPDRTGRLKYDPAMDESWSFSAGAMYSTVEDMEKFSDALQSEALLPRAALERMWQPVRDVYGYGWQTPQRSRFTFNRRVVEHGGAAPGFLARFWHAVDEKLTVIVLANNMATSPPRVAQSLAALVLNEPFVPSYMREAVQLAPEVLRRYVGEYQLGTDVWKLYTRDGRLFARRDVTEPEIELLAESESAFFLRDVEGDAVAMENGKGAVTGFMVNLGEQSRMMRKLR